MDVAVKEREKKTERERKGASDRSFLRHDRPAVNAATTNRDTHCSLVYMAGGLLTRVALSEKRRQIGELLQPAVAFMLAD